MTAPSRVVVIGLGGTIAAPVDERGSNATMALGGDDLVRELIGDLPHEVEGRSFRLVPSAALTFADLDALAQEVDAVLAAGAAGVVVTVGTDSLEEVAYALDLQYGGESPVVVTGAMRNAGLPGADGAANLRAAVAVAAHPDARSQGVLVVLADEIHSARYVQKSHSSSLTAFRSANAGPIGWLTEGRVTIALRRAARPDPLVPDPTASPAVRLITAALDADPAVIDEALAGGAAGLVLAAFGAGHVAPSWVETLARAAHAVPVVYVSRTGAGGLYERTGSYPGSERDLLAAGLIPGGALDPLKARVLLRSLLASGKALEEIRSRFAAE